MLLCLCLTGCGGKKSLTLNVYNWGEYISDGSEGSFETVPGIREVVRGHL